MLGGYAAWVFEERGINGAALPLFSVSLTILVMLLEDSSKSLGSRFAYPYHWPVHRFSTGWVCC